jgi:predicted dehydrogenase
MVDPVRPRKLKMGYVGCGFMAQKVHIPNILSLDTCELVALAEIRPRLGKLVQERFRIPRLYTTHTELAKDKEIEAVAVSGHFSAQGDIAVDLLLAGKDVIMEKPMAVSIEQGQRILDAEQRSGKRLMVAYMKRYDAGNIQVKKLLERVTGSGEMGQLRFVRNHGFGGDWTAGLPGAMDQTDEPYPACASAFPSWMPERNRDGYLGYLQQYTHNINLMRWFLGTGAPRVLSTHLDAKDGWRGVVVLEFIGVTASLESGWIDYQGWDEHTQLFFDNGWVRTEAPPLLLKNVPASVEVYQGKGADGKTTTSTFPAGGRSWAYTEEMRHFVAAVLAGTPFTSPAADAMEDVRTLEAIYRMHVDAQGRTPLAAAAKG